MEKQTKILNTDLSYIAGFLDGDGSVIVQVKNRKDSPRGWRLMFTICFYQDTRHEEPLFWIQKKLGIGYISKRNDGITELRINGYKQVKKILEEMYPYIRFKRRQIKYVLQILKLLEPNRNLFKTKQKDRVKIVRAILKSRQETYQSGLKSMKKLKSDLRKILEV